MDDCLLIGSNSQVIEKVMEELKKHYELTETKEKKFLNIRIRESRKNIELSQAEYINEILGTHGLQDAKPTATSMDVQQKLDNHQGSPVADQTKFDP